MFIPEFSNQFKRSCKLMMKRGANPKLLEKAISLIVQENHFPLLTKSIIFPAIIRITKNATFYQTGC